MLVPRSRQERRAGPTFTTEAQSTQRKPSLRDFQEVVLIPAALLGVLCVSVVNVGNNRRYAVGLRGFTKRSSHPTISASVCPTLSRARYPCASAGNCT